MNIINQEDFFISKTNPKTERPKAEGDSKKPDWGIDKSPVWKVYRLHFIALIILIISVFIGVREIKITNNISFLLLPITYSIVIGMLFYLSKHLK